MKHRFSIVFAFVLGFACGIVLYHEQQEKADAKRRQEFAAVVDSCGKLTPVADRNMRVRCAHRVPGIAWQPFIDEIHADRALQNHLKQLARRSQ